MATSDKHCQTQTFCVKNSLRNNKVNFSPKYYKGMYDETVEVNAKEIESPSSSENEVVLKSAMSKFNPPVRHIARHDFNSDSDSESEPEPEQLLTTVSGEDQSGTSHGATSTPIATASPEQEPEQLLTTVSGEDESPDRKSLQSEQAEKSNVSISTKPIRPQSNARRERGKSALSRRAVSSNSDSDSADLEEPDLPDPLSMRSRAPGMVIPAEGTYDPTQYQGLKVPQEIEQCFQYIMKYTPQKIDIEFKLQPFVPDYIPAVGDTDALLKVITPSHNANAEPLAEPLLEHIDNLGLMVLDEPSSDQSDSALLHLQLRALSKTNSAKSTVLTKKIENAEKNPKAIDRWIKDISELHLSKPAPTVTYTSKMPDIDTLMEEWPDSVERALSQHGIPSAAADCTLTQYAELVCALLDAPITSDSPVARLQALHLLFSLYAAVKSSQLYLDREKEKETA